MLKLSFVDANTFKCYDKQLKKKIDNFLIHKIILSNNLLKIFHTKIMPKVT